MAVVEQLANSTEARGVTTASRFSVTSVLSRIWHLALVVGPAAMLGLLGYRHRWIADDGLIVVRAAKMILAGHGPVYNVGERAEASTSVLWTWLVAAAGFITGLNVAKLTVYGGLTLTVLGFAFALDGTRRMYRSAAAWLAPAGCLVVLALPPFWDFATSGLETGLMIAWLSLSWWFLVGLSRSTPTWWRYLAAFVFGLGELVRPDLTVATIIFGGAGWLLVRPARRQVAGLLGAAFAIPVVYQIFRMGYYGVLVPNTAIAKEAQKSHWSSGWAYAENFVTPYYLWLPVSLLVVATVAVWWRRTGRSIPDNAVAPLAAVATGTVLAIYIIKVGGDFMHGRMLLPATLCLLLPVLLLPARIPVLAIVTAVAVWAAMSAQHFRTPLDQTPEGFSDERRHWIPLTHPYPISEAEYRGLAHWTPHLDVALETRALVYPGEEIMKYRIAPLRYHKPAAGALLVRILGVPSTAMPVDALAIDQIGLAYPLAAHIEMRGRARPGHDKQLPQVWALADYTPDDFVPAEADPAALGAARRALRCGELAELQRSVRDPMTFDRFRRNLVGSVSRTFMRFPSDPAQAERKYC